MISRKEVAAVVVTYNCDVSDFKKSLDSYKNFVDCVYICDNSDNTHLNVLQSESNIAYISMNGNNGIAAALNMGCKRAWEQGYKWILTMDQDSRFLTSIDSYIQSCNNAANTNVALFCPEYRFHDEIRGEETIIAEHYVKKSIQSGCLLNLGTFVKLGCFTEKYFIDYVDYEYCRRLLKAGYTLKKIPTVILAHKRGSLCTRNIFGKKYTFAFSSPVRVYYQTRNSLDYYLKYHDFNDMFSRFLILSRTILFEYDRLSKIKAIYWGVLDYLRGRWYKTERNL